MGLTAAAVALAAGAGYGGWRTGRSDLERVGSLERRVRSLEIVAATLTSDKDRLKADRDRLETLLAGADAPPAACPNATVSTLGAPLSVRFIVEYPCGWSVLEHPLQVPEAESPRYGLAVDHLFFSPFPISLKPSGGPLAEITLDAWYDEPGVGGELPPLADWLTEARGRFTDPAERGVKTTSGLSVVLLEGDIVVSDRTRPALLYAWEHTDTDGVRRIYEAFALEPSRTVRTAIEALVRSFRFPGG
ncbi:MAG: hypothetical protein ACRDKG_00150 [Actinomycetota bacterium]